jgi:hypothetical protein
MPLGLFLHPPPEIWPAVIGVSVLTPWRWELSALLRWSRRDGRSATPRAISVGIVRSLVELARFDGQVLCVDYAVWVMVLWWMAAS